MVVPGMAVVGIAVVVGGIVVVILSGQALSRKGPIISLKYYSFMWGLAAAAGGPVLGAVASFGSGLAGVLNFSV